MTNLKYIVNKSYNHVTKNIVRLNRLENDNLLHNLNRLKFLKKGKLTYDGKSCCGAASFILGKHLIKNNYNVNMYLYKFGYADYYQDHVHLRYKNYIIDPTYKQFFYNNSKNSISAYNNYLYNLPPFFFGTYQDLNYLISKLNNLSKYDLGFELDNDLIELWNKKQDITDKLYSIDN